MTKQILLIGLLTGLFGNLSCNDRTNNKTLQVQSNAQHLQVTSETLKQILMHSMTLMQSWTFSPMIAHLIFQRDQNLGGQRFIGKAQVREALAGRFKGIPDVHYGDDRGFHQMEIWELSEWTLTGTTASRTV